MAYSSQSVVSDGSLVILGLSISYYRREDISVYFNGVAQLSGWAWVGTLAKTITFSPAVPAGVTVTVRRTTDVSGMRNVFSNGAQFRASNVDNDFSQLLHAVQEIRESGVPPSVIGGLDMANERIRNLGPGVLGSDAINKAQLDSAIAGVGGGSSVTAENVGLTGLGLFKSKIGNILGFKRLIAGSGIALTAADDSITVESTVVGGGGGNEYFADVTDFGAVGDFVPAAGSTGTGTDNATAFGSAIATGRPLWIPAGNFYIGAAVRAAFSKCSSAGPGTVWGDSNVGKVKLGKLVSVGTTRSHELNSVGGLLLGGESGDGMRQWMGHNNWMQWQPTKYGAPAQVQVYSNAVMAQATCQSPNILNATNGTTFDTAKLDVGDQFGWYGAVYKIASVTPTSLTCTTLGGGSPAFVTNSTARPFYHAYESATGTVNTSGTVVTYASGEQFPYGYTGDHMTARINGTLYTVSLGPESLTANTLSLASSAGNQTGVPCVFKRCYGPRAYVSLMRLQGLIGGYETNGGMYLNIKNELVLFNGATHANLSGNLRVNAVRVRIGNDDGTEQIEVGSNYASLGGYYGSESLRAVPVANAVNRLEVYGASNGFAPVFAARGADPNPDMGFDLKGNGAFRFTAGSFGRSAFEVYAPAATAVWPTVAAGVASATFSVNSALANADIVVAPKGVQGKSLIKKVPVCMLERSAVLPFPSGAGTTIPWDTEISDVHDMHTPGASAVVVPVAGIYRINGSVQIAGPSDANGVNITSLYLLKNGAAVKASPVVRHRGPNGSTYSCGTQLSCLVELAASDALTMQLFYAGSGSDALLDTSFKFTYFEVELVTAY